MTSLRRISTLAVLCLTLLALGASSASAKVVNVTQAKSGSTVTIKRGDLLILKLDEADNPSTGYSWQYAKVPNGKLLKLNYSKATPAGQRIKYTAKKAGKTKLVLGYFPPVQGEPSVASFTLTVVIR
jgi:predicted secreted protein